MARKRYTTIRRFYRVVIMPYAPMFIYIGIGVGEYHGIARVGKKLRKTGAYVAGFNKNKTGYFYEDVCDQSNKKESFYFTFHWERGVMRFVLQGSFQPAEYR